MHEVLKSIGLAITIGILAGCAQLSTYNHTAVASLKRPEKSFVDAKQRVIITTPGWKWDKDGKVYRQVVRVCAEPSPDALSAIATSGNGSLSAKDKLTLQAAFSFAETASNIGLRTQTIQLMRDAMYRLCEAVASDNLSSAQFETLQRRFQNSMVAIVAIEQLTGTVRPANVMLSTSTSLGSAKEIATLTQNAADARDKSVAADKTAADKKDAVAKADKAATDYADGKDPEVLKTDKAYIALQDTLAKAKADQKTADAAAADAKEKLAIYDTGLKAIGGGNITASGTATTNGGSGPDTVAVAAVATSVEHIVKEQLDLGFLREACATYFVAEIDRQIDQGGKPAKAPTDGFAPQCLAYANATVADLQASTTLKTALAANVVEQTKKGVAISTALADAIKNANKEPSPLMMLQTKPIAGLTK